MPKTLPKGIAMSLHSHLSATLASAVILAATAGASSGPAPQDRQSFGALVANAQVIRIALATTFGPDGNGTGPRKACPITPLVAIPVLVLLPWPGHGPRCDRH
jgi:hypothetical protein